MTHHARCRYSRLEYTRSSEYAHNFFRVLHVYPSCIYMLNAKFLFVISCARSVLLYAIVQVCIFIYLNVRYVFMYKISCMMTALLSLLSAIVCVYTTYLLCVYSGFDSSPRHLRAHTHTRTHTRNHTRTRIHTHCVMQCINPHTLSHTKTHIRTCIDSTLLWYGVAMISMLLQKIGLFCRI